MLDIFSVISAKCSMAVITSWVSFSRGFILTWVGLFIMAANHRAREMVEAKLLL